MAVFQNTENEGKNQLMDSTKAKLVHLPVIIIAIALGLSASSANSSR